ncbi:MAG: right-handed parallel beta-helix repeat-containing protein, partial [Promethearchaeota archaeon]
MLKKKLILLLCLTILAGLSVTITSKDYSNFSSYTETKDPSIYNLKKGGSWDLTNVSIFIDDSDPNYNWSKTVSENDWCSGTGTVNDPYLIENVTIDSYYSGTCIEIRNSHNFFKIQNCTLYNSGSGSWEGGVILNNTSNGEITGCQFLNHNIIAISVHNCVNATIIKNSIENCARGITFLDSNSSLLAENLFFSISQTGVTLFRSYENTIKNNIIRNLLDGIGNYLLLIDSTNNSIKGNIIGGIYLWDLESNIGDGITLWNSNTTTITENIFIRIGDCIFLDSSSSNNLLYKNYFNSYYMYPCRDRGINTSWDNGSIGNYWSGYNGNDTNHDGIGDIPYNFSDGID